MANYEKKTFTKREDRPAQVNMTLALGKSNYYSSFDEKDSLLDTLSLIRFDKVSIAVMAKKSFLFDNDEAKGYMPIGWVLSWDGSKFKCSINPKYAAKVNESDFVIVPRCRKVDGSIDYIISLGIEKGVPCNEDEINESFFDSCEAIETDD